MVKDVLYNPNANLTLNEVRALLFQQRILTLSTEALAKVDHSYTFLKDFSADKIIYGINTGFGPMAQYRIEDDSLKQLQYNIIRSHSTGGGCPAVSFVCQGGDDCTTDDLFTGVFGCTCRTGRIAG